MNSASSNLRSSNQKRFLDKTLSIYKSSFLTAARLRKPDHNASTEIGSFPIRVTMEMPLLRSCPLLKPHVIL